MLWHGIPIGISTLRLSQHNRALRDLLLNQRCVPILHAPGAVDKAVRFLVGKQPPLVMGPPSALFYLARELRERGIRKPLAPFARVGGEQLFAFQRAEIERYLGARVINSYGCTEIGAIAGECSAGSLHLCADHVHCEIFNGDAPVMPGVIGDIVVTALHNPAMPLIRYRLGDRGRISAERCRCGLPHPVLMDVQARAADTIRAADGSMLHGAELLSRMGPFFADPAADVVRQFQFVQKDPRSWQVLVEIRPPGSLSVAAGDRLAGIVREVYGAECAVETKVVEWIRRDSGKYGYYRVEPAPQPASRAA
jgi:phenylacetate-CoA ligase